jgi:hypothetical protein
MEAIKAIVNLAMDGKNLGNKTKQQQKLSTIFSTFFLIFD